MRFKIQLLRKKNRKLMWYKKKGNKGRKKGSHRTRYNSLFDTPDTIKKSRRNDFNHALVQDHLTRL
jgi:hypothetical protein